MADRHNAEKNKAARHCVLYKQFLLPSYGMVNGELTPNIRLDLL